LLYIYKIAKQAKRFHKYYKGVTVKHFGMVSWNEKANSFSYPITVNVYLVLESCRRICYIIDRKRESHRNGYPSENQHLMLYSISRQLFAVVGGYFRFPLKTV